METVLQGELDALRFTVWFRGTEDAMGKDAAKNVVKLRNGLRDVADLLAMLCRDFLGLEVDAGSYFVEAGFAGQGFRTVYRSPEGINVWCHPASGSYASVEMKGKCLDTIGRDRLEALRDALLESYREGGGRIKGTRLDVAWDGFPVSPGGMRDAWLAGDCVTRIRSDSYDWRSNGEGDTLYIGKRTSDVMLRIYNRRASGSRLEGEFKGDAAEVLFICWLEGCLTEQAKLHLLDLVDFRQRGSNPRSNRRERLDWWAQWAVCAGEKRVRDRVVVPLAPEIREMRQARLLGERAMAKMLEAVEAAIAADQDPREVLERVLSAWDQVLEDDVRKGSKRLARIERARAQAGLRPYRRGVAKVA